MGRDPAVLFYTSDFLSGTQFFTDAQTGQYIKLLCQQHQLGHIPDEHMLNICKTYDSPVMLKFEKDPQGLWFNRRMDEEKEKRLKYSESRRRNKTGKKSTGHMTEHMTEHMSIHMENENENIHTPILSTVSYSKEFNTLWEQYPRKVGRKDALRHFMATVKTSEDVTAIQAAFKHYLESERVYKGFVQNGDTWFNNWKDWENYEEPVCKNCNGRGMFTSSTGYESICNCPKGNYHKRGRQA